MAPQFSLFDSTDNASNSTDNASTCGEKLLQETELPNGFSYHSEFISSAKEESLLSHIRKLPFREFEFHGHTGKRRVISFGWQYDFAGRQLQLADDIPSFLTSLQANAANMAALEPKDLPHVLITEYDAGAGIGWHRDKTVFGQVVGFSLLAPCKFRLRRAVGERWERVNLVLEPRSGYILSGPARSVWEHSIPSVDTLRYSITFRTIGQG